MVTPYKTLLLTSCISFSLSSMDTAPAATAPSTKELSLQPSQPNGLTEQNIADIKNLYKKTHKKLESHTPENNDSALNLLKIMSRTEHLKRQGITEQHIGAFAYDQEESETLTNKIFSALSSSPYNGPLYVSVVFDRLARHNNTLIKNKLINPTPEQLATYRRNREKELICNDAATVGIYIDATKVKVEDLPKEVAAEAFDKLMTDIYGMRNKTPENIFTLATQLYGNIEQKTKQ